MKAFKMTYVASIFILEWMSIAENLDGWELVDVVRVLRLLRG